MYRIAAVVVISVAGILLAGCDSNKAGPGRKTMRETGWGSGAWGAYQESRGDNTPAIKSAVQTIRTSNDTAAKVAAANQLAAMHARTNLVSEGLEDGMDSKQPMDVRLASARALSIIGGSTAIHHLREAEDDGLIPVYRDYSVLNKYGQFPTTGPAPAARETRTTIYESTGNACPPAVAPKAVTNAPCENTSTGNFSDQD